MTSGKPDWKQEQRRRPHHRNRVWQLAKQLCLQIHRVTSFFPNDERFELKSQLRRAAVSVPSNVAEGQARRSTKAYLHFLGIARGSLNEIDTQMEIAEELGYLTAVDLTETIDTFDNLSRALQGLINSLERKIGGP